MQSLHGLREIFHILVLLFELLQIPEAHPHICKPLSYVSKVSLLGCKHHDSSSCPLSTVILYQASANLLQVAMPVAMVLSLPYQSMTARMGGVNLTGTSQMEIF